MDEKTVFSFSPSRMTKKIEITVSPTRISNNSENRRETRVTDEWTPTRQHARMVVRVSLIGNWKVETEIRA